MRKVCFLTSHEGAGSDALFDALAATNRAVCYRTSQTYNHPLAVENLTLLPHKNDTVAAVWVEQLLHNYQFCCKELYPVCRFIYVVAPAEQSLRSLVADGYEQGAALRYYSYRLRRICEMARRTPGAVLLTWEDMQGRGLPLVESYLSLKESLRVVPRPAKKASVRWPLVEQGQSCYERHLYYLRNQNLCLYR